MGTRARPLLAVLLIVTAVLVVLWTVQRRLIYFPDTTAPPPAADVLPGALDVSFSTADGVRLNAWLVPPTADDRRIAVLVAPGNAGNRAGRAPLAVALARQGFTVLLLDYRGYGGNPGSPTEDGLAGDARAAWAYLTGEAGYPPQRVVLFGESLGGGVVTGLAAGLESGPESGPGGVVLRSPFTSLVDVGREHYPFLPVRAILLDRYPVADLVSQIKAPTAVVYGAADAVVPAEQSRRVAGSAANLVHEFAVAGADHNDPELLAGPAVIDAVLEVASRLGP